MLDEFRNDDSKVRNEVKELLRAVHEYDNPIRNIEDLEEFY